MFENTEEIRQARDAIVEVGVHNVEFFNGGYILLTLRDGDVISIKGDYMEVKGELMGKTTVELEQSGYQIPYRGSYTDYTLTFSGDFGSFPRRDRALQVLRGFIGDVPLEEECEKTMAGHFANKITKFEPDEASLYPREVIGEKEPMASVWHAKTFRPYAD